LSLGIILFSQFGTHAVSAELDQDQVENAEADFDTTFLSGNVKSIDISQFKYDNPVLAGEYDLDIYLNTKWIGRKKMVFREIKGHKTAMLCFTKAEMQKFGVKSEILNKHAEEDNTDCLAIGEWVESAFYEYDNNKLRLDISIPQIALINASRDAVNVSDWDRGINAAYLSYNAGAYKSFSRENSPDSTNVFVGFTAGANILGWQLRHFGQWSWNDQASSEIGKSNYTSGNTYLQRPIPQFRGLLTLGENNTSGRIFDSVNYRGIDFSSDERMLPNSMLGYAPRIRGNAMSNSKVEVRQNGQLIYQTTVAAGPFEINDLYATGYGGDLEVSVIEASGEIQQFSVPYASVVEMLRPGLDRYSVTIAQYNGQNTSLNPWFTELKYERGLNTYLTGYSGLQWTEGYAALAVGAAVGTQFGAIR